MGVAYCFELLAEKLRVESRCASDVVEGAFGALRIIMSLSRIGCDHLCVHVRPGVAQFSHAFIVLQHHEICFFGGKQGISNLCVKWYNGLSSPQATGGGPMLMTITWASSAAHRIESSAPLPLLSLGSPFRSSFASRDWLCLYVCQT